MVSEVKRLAISFSGGRSSAVMTKILLEKLADSHEIIVTFANTGCEHEATLQFVRDCDMIWNFKTVWLEAVIGPEGVGPRAKVVTFETASRNGDPKAWYFQSGESELHEPPENRSNGVLPAVAWLGQK